MTPTKTFELTKTCRTAGIQDTDVIVQMISDYMVKTPYTEFNFSKERVINVLQPMMLDMQNNIVLASTDGDKVVGALCGRKVLPPFSYDTVAVEIFWGMIPGYETGRRGYELLVAYEQWARKVGCTHMQYAKMFPSHAEDRDEDHRGYRMIEKSFQKRLI